MRSTTYRAVAVYAAWMSGLWLCGARLRDRVMQRPDDDRGDVPGWVMVTVMTAILVVAIIGVFEPQIKDALRSIIQQVTDAGNKN